MERVLMKKQPIAPLLLSIILLAGISGCNLNSSNQPKTTENSSNTSEVNGSENSQLRSVERSQRREQIRQQVKAILNPEQVKELDAKMQSGEKMRQALTELSLTAEQKTKIDEIYTTARANRK
jgi:Spy/CpxP family protein refolding chaperone